MRMQISIVDYLIECNRLKESDIMIDILARYVPKAVDLCHYVALRLTLRRSGLIYLYVYVYNLVSS